MPISNHDRHADNAPNSSSLDSNPDTPMLSNYLFRLYSKLIYREVHESMNLSIGVYLILFLGRFNLAVEKNSLAEFGRKIY